MFSGNVRREFLFFYLSLVFVEGTGAWEISCKCLLRDFEGVVKSRLKTDADVEGKLTHCLLRNFCVPGKSFGVTSWKRCVWVPFVFAGSISDALKPAVIPLIIIGISHRSFRSLQKLTRMIFLTELLYIILLTDSWLYAFQILQIMSFMAWGTVYGNVSQQILLPVTFLQISLQFVMDFFSKTVSPTPNKFFSPFLYQTLYKRSANWQMSVLKRVLVGAKPFPCMV